MHTNTACKFPMEELGFLFPYNRRDDDCAVERDLTPLARQNTPRLAHWFGCNEVSHLPRWNALSVCERRVRHYALQLHASMDIKCTVTQVSLPWTRALQLEHEGVAILRAYTARQRHTPHNHVLPDCSAAGSFRKLEQCFVVVRTNMQRLRARVDCLASHLMSLHAIVCLLHAHQNRELWCMGWQSFLRLYLMLGVQTKLITWVTSGEWASNNQNSYIGIHPPWSTLKFIEYSLKCMKGGR